MEQLGRGRAQGRRSVCRREYPFTYVYEVFLGALQNCRIGHEEGLPPFVHLPLAYKILGAGLGSDVELEELL